MISSDQRIEVEKAYRNSGEQNAKKEDTAGRQKSESAPQPDKNNPESGINGTKHAANGENPVGRLEKYKQSVQKEEQKKYI